MWSLSASESDASVAASGSGGLLGGGTGSGWRTAPCLASTRPAPTASRARAADQLRRMKCEKRGQRSIERTVNRRPVVKSRFPVGLGAFLGYSSGAQANCDRGCSIHPRRSLDAWMAQAASSRSPEVGVRRLFCAATWHALQHDVPSHRALRGLRRLRNGRSRKRVAHVCRLHPAPPPAHVELC